MKRRYIIGFSLVALLLATFTSVAMAQTERKTAKIADAVRQATTQFKDVEAAKAAGYGLFHGCANGPQEGSMGIHFANGGLAGDGKIDVQHPEALLYEPKDGKMRLLGVEYLVLAKDWDANNTMPPVLMGQLFNYVSAPNRYGLPAFYELHVWAWKYNPNGMFSDWNPHVSCEDFAGDGDMHMSH